MRYKAEWLYGKVGEDKIIRDFIKEGFKSIVPNDIYCLYDVVVEGYKMEIKTRRTPIQKYDTTIIPVHKLKCDIDFFIFNFIDGVYYCDRDDVKRCKIIPIKRCDRNETVLHYSIPINTLKSIKNLYDIIRKNGLLQ